MITMTHSQISDITITALCLRLGISRQGYYQDRQRSRQRRKTADQVLGWVRQERAKHPRMGGRKLYQRLKPRMKSAGIKMGRDKLFDLLRDHQLLVTPRRRRGPRTTNGRTTKWTNQLAGADINGPNQGWVADITYLRTHEGFCYLALISDVYSRKILGWNLSESLELDGALRSLNQALEKWTSSEIPIHHSDRGSQYRSNIYLRTLQAHNCRISMTEQNHCAENAQAERLNGILKNEYLLDQVFRDTNQAREAAQQAIVLYNTDRPHLSLNYNTPEKVHRAA